MTTAGAGGSGSEFNPFGDRGYDYLPDLEEEYIVKDTKEKKDWVKVTLILVLVALVSILVGNFMVSNTQQQRALDSMSDFNTAATDVHRSFSENAAITKFKNVENDESLDGDVRQAGKIVSSLGQQLRGGSYSTITADTSSADAAETVLPYYAICDSVDMIHPHSDAGEYKSLCNDFSTIALTMMDEVQKFNHLKTGISGFLNPTLGDILPDVTQ